MKKFFYLFLAALVCSAEAKAQFSVEDDTKTTKGKVEFVDRVKEMDASADYYSEAAARAERRRIRNERNYLEVNAKLQGSMTSYNDAWTTSRGGDNAMTVLGTFSLKHTFKKGDFTIATDASARYGYNRIKVENESGKGKGIWFKNIDEFWVQTQPAHKIRKNWDMSALIKFRSQFSGTYLSRTEQSDDDVISSLFTPGYLDISVGFTFKSPQPKFPIEISLNPLSTSGAWATNDKVRHYYKDIKGATTWFGIDIDKNSLFTGGSSVNIKFSRKWGKSEWFSYDTNLYCYYGWLTNVGRASKIRRYNHYLKDLKAWESAGSIEANKPTAVPAFVCLHPTIEWRNTISFRASKYFSTDIYLQLNYDKAQNTSVQLYSMLTLGLTYTFKNK
ncbi:MAG: DUF3078 domain-containing protein [Rikenellaceae bacterium]|nr:DUF3078 domain-containing protein [Rikenellaceae bacterium]